MAYTLKGTNDVIALATGGRIRKYYVPAVRIGLEETDMENIPSVILAQYITDTVQLFTAVDSSGAGDWPLYINSMPDVAVNCGCIYDIPGSLDGRIMRTGGVIQHFGIQLKTRATNHSDGWKQIENTAIELSKAHNETIIVDGTTYEIQNISRTGTVIPLGQDEKRKFTFVVSFRVTIKEIEE